MNSMRLRPPRPPGERASWERQPTEAKCTADKVSAFGAKPVCSANRAARFRLCLPLEGKVPEGRMRCRLRVAEPFTGEKVTLFSVTRCRATPHQSADADSCLAAARVSSSSASGTAVLDLPRRSIHYQAPASQPSKGKPRRMFAAVCLTVRAPTCPRCATCTEPSR